MKSSPRRLVSPPICLGAFIGLGPLGIIEQSHLWSWRCDQTSNGQGGFRTLLARADACGVWLPLGSSRGYYESAARKLQSKHARFNIKSKFHDLPTALRIHKLASGLNAGFDFHGTDHATAETIARLGFDERFSKGIYGDGLCILHSRCLQSLAIRETCS